MSAVATSLGELVRFGLPADYWDRYPQAVEALDAASLQRAAMEHVHPGRMTWLVVGDRAKIEAGLREQFGTLVLLDSDGNPIGAAAPALGQ